MKKITILLILIIVFSCAADRKNPSGLNPDELTEEDIYMYYGLEAPPDVYEFLHQKLKSNEEFNEIWKENTVSHFVAVDIEIKNKIIVDAETRYSDYSSTLDTLLVKSLINQQVNFSFIEGKNGGYNFRIDIQKLGEGKDFSTTPPKDSTLKTMPRLNEYLDKMKEFRVEPFKMEPEIITN